MLSFFVSIPYAQLLHSLDLTSAEFTVPTLGKIPSGSNEGGIVAGCLGLNPLEPWSWEHGFPCAGLQLLGSYMCPFLLIRCTPIPLLKLKILWFVKVVLRTCTSVSSFPLCTQAKERSEFCRMSGLCPALLFFHGSEAQTFRVYTQLCLS